GEVERDADGAVAGKVGIGGEVARTGDGAAGERQPGGIVENRMAAGQRDRVGADRERAVERQRGIVLDLYLASGEREDAVDRAVTRDVDGAAVGEAAIDGRVVHR